VADTLVEKAAIDTDVEPALIIDTWKEQDIKAISQHSTSTRSAPPNHQSISLARSPHHRYERL
jgi:hypothetical protein